jgi:crossover junction endodeoxyribonuclease RusA
MQLTMPYPPSINHYWRHFRGRVVISREGRAFRTSVQALPALAGNAGTPRKPPSGGRIALCMDAYPPDRRRRDLDNTLKSAVDSMQHAGFYEDDSQIDLLCTRRCGVEPPGRLEVRLIEFPLTHCPLCHAPLTQPLTSPVNPENN